MKKKIISGLFVGLFVGGLGFVTVSEARGIVEENHMGSSEMARRREQHRETMNEQQVNENQQDKEGTNKDYFSRRQDRDQTYMRRVRESHRNKMNGSCW